MHTLIKLLSILIIALATTAPTLPATNDANDNQSLPITQHPNLPESLRAAIDAAALEEFERQQAVGLAIGVIREGKVVYTAGYGLADRERNIPVTADTLFRWASISKPLTAVAAMQLVENRKLDLDADIRTLVPEFPDKGTPITARQLLSHTSGIVHYSNGPVIKTTREYDTLNSYQSVINALDTFAESPLVAKPGERYEYSTHAYILASAAIERAGNAPYAQQVHERICEPLKLTTLQPDYQWLDIPNRAVGYRKFGNRIFRSTDTDVSWKLAGGGWISNINDLTTFTAALMDDQLLRARTTMQMWTPQQTADGETLDYALGFTVDNFPDNPRIAHSGSQEKARTRMVLYPKQRHALVVMTNSEFVNPARITTAIYAAINKWHKQNDERAR